MDTKPPLRCRAFLLCGRIEQHPATKALSLVHLFTEFRMGQFPGNTWPFGMFIELTNGRGDYALKIEFRNGKTNTLVNNIEGGTHSFPNTDYSVYVAMAMEPMFVPEPGIYEFALIADGREIGRYSYTAQGVTG